MIILPEVSAAFTASSVHRKRPKILMYCEYVPVFVLLRCTKSAAKIDTYFFQGCRSRGAIKGA